MKSQIIDEIEIYSINRLQQRFRSWRLHPYIAFDSIREFVARKERENRQTIFLNYFSRQVNGSTQWLPSIILDSQFLFSKEKELHHL